MNPSVEGLLASLFLVVAHYTLWWALIVYGIGITPRSWGVVIACAVAQATIGVITKVVMKDARTR